jgi:carboxypeptidase D
MIQFGGKFGPTFASYFEEQNEKIKSRLLKKHGAIPIHIGTLGFVNEYTDMLTQRSFYPEMAFNNTYGLEAITRDEYDASKLAYSQPGAVVL